MRTKIIILATSILLALATFAETSDAQDRNSSTEIGVILGEPTGLSLKAWTSDNTAFDLAAAWSFGGSGSLHLHGDYLRHNWLNADAGSLALYYGLGARVKLADDPRLGARIPIGLQYMIPDTRLSAFFEVAPLFDVVPETSFDVNGGIGLRIFI